MLVHLQPSARSHLWNDELGNTWLGVKIKSLEEAALDTLEQAKGVFTKSCLEQAKSLFTKYVILLVTRHFKECKHCKDRFSSPVAVFTNKDMILPSGPAKVSVTRPRGPSYSDTLYAQIDRLEK